MLRPCPARRTDGTVCGRLHSNRRFCNECGRSYERQRKEDEPWQHFYDDPRWFATTRRVRARDGHRCTYQVGTRRCISEGPLSVHHEVKLRHLWSRAGGPRRGGPGWNKFVLSGLDMRNLRLMCERHHKLVDNNNPAEKWVGIPPKKPVRKGRRRSLHQRGQRLAQKRQPGRRRRYSEEDGE